MGCIVEDGPTQEQSKSSRVEEIEIGTSKRCNESKAPSSPSSSPSAITSFLNSNDTETTAMDSGLKWLVFTVVLLLCSFVVYLCKLAAAASAGNG